MTHEYINDNTLAASLLIERLVQNGVTNFVISPGSRSAPLTIAAARNPGTHTEVHFDERGAAFFALGRARASGVPTVLICTSGTAVANYFPAVIEASAEMIPLILLTADRPPELRNCGANQTIDQVNIFGRYVRDTIDLPCPDEGEPAEFWLGVIDAMMTSALKPPPGPVHLNCPFREPLAPVESRKNSILTASIQELLRSEQLPRPTLPAVSLSTSDETDAVVEVLHSADSGLVILGHLGTADKKQAVARLIDALGWTVFPDIRSQLRLAERTDHIFPYYDLFITAGGFETVKLPEVVFQIGTRIVSKSVLQLLERWRPRHHILLTSDPRPHNPSHTVTQTLAGDLLFLCTKITEQASPGSQVEMLPAGELFKRLDDLLDESFTDNRLREPSVVRRLSRMLPSESNLFLASSMPVRLMDRYAATGLSVQVASNRGASGIDGTVASAAGFAAASGKLTTLLIGDLGLLHDLNSLVLLRKLQVPVIVIVLNNDGGGIFDHLPVAQCNDVVEQFFVAPHGKQFEQAAVFCDLTYARPATFDELETAYNEAVVSTAPALIEVPIDRTSSLEAQATIVSGIRKLLA